MGQSNYSGPINSTGGFIAGASGATISQILKGTVSVTVAALAAAGEADVDVTVTGVAAGDSVIMTPLEAAAETGLMWQAWVGAADTVSIRMTNLNAAAALSGSTTNWQYLIVQS